MKNSFAALFIIIVAAALYIANIKNCPVSSFHDDSYYVLTARQIAGVYDPTKIPHLFFSRPLGYTLLLAPVVRLFPGKIIPVKIFTISLYLLALFFVYKVFEDRLEKQELFLFLFLCATNPVMLHYSVAVMNESAFILFNFLSVWLLKVYFAGGKGKSKNLLFTILALTALGITRVEGLFLFGFVFLWFLYSGKRKTALFFFLFYSLLMLPLELKGGGRGYDYNSSWDIFLYTFKEGHLREVISRNFIEYLRLAADKVVLPISAFFEWPFALKILAGSIIALFALRGFVRPILASGLDAVLRCYILSYVVIHLLLPAYRDRYFVGFAPFLIFFFLRGVEKIGYKVKYAVFPVLTLLYLANAFQEISHSRSAKLPEESFTYIKEKIPEGAHLASNLAFNLIFLTGRACIDASSKINCDENYAYYLRSDIEYVVMFHIYRPGTAYSFAQGNVASEKRSRQYLLNGERFEPIYVNEKEKVVIFKLRDEFKKTFKAAMKIAHPAAEKFKKGDFDTAEKLYKEALKINGSIPVIINNLALVYTIQGKSDEAEKTLLEGIRRCPDSPMLYNMAGEVFIGKGMLEEAKKYFEVAGEKARKMFDNHSEKIAAQRIVLMNENSSRFAGETKN